MDARLLTEGDLIRVVAWSGDKVMGMFRVERRRGTDSLALYNGPAYGTAIELSPAGWELRDIDTTLSDGRKVRETELVRVGRSVGEDLGEVQEAMRVKDVLRVHCPPPLTDPEAPLRLRLEAVKAEADQLRVAVSQQRDANNELNHQLAVLIDRCTRLTREKAHLQKCLDAAIHGWHRDTAHMTRGQRACPCGECSPKVEGGYTQVEQDCKGCMGPCGRCHELADAKLAAAGVTQVPSLFGPDQPSKPDQRALGDDATYRSGSNECPCPMCVGARGLQC